jgi:hypothetical protein
VIVNRLSESVILDKYFWTSEFPAHCSRSRRKEGRSDWRLNTNPQTGLPDGIFPNKNPELGKFLEGLAMKDFGLFYGTLV